MIGYVLRGETNAVVLPGLESSSALEIAVQSLFLDLNEVKGYADTS